MLPGRRRILGLSLTVGLLTQACGVLASVVKRSAAGNDRLEVLARFSPS